MNDFSATLLMFALGACVVGMAGALLFQRAERWANALGFGLAAAGGAPSGAMNLHPLAPPAQNTRK